MQIAFDTPDTTTVATTTITTTAAPTGNCIWGQASPDVKCNQGAGEVPLKKSSVMASSLEQCKKSCEYAAGCRSVTYFKTKWCAHFSTPCTKTKKSGKAIVERLATPCTPALTTSEFTLWLCGPPRQYFCMHAVANSRMHTHFACSASRPGWVRLGIG